jgi:hypothetical protein
LPSTYSSAKFLSPIVIAGLPLPGKAELELVDVVLDLLELPHAASMSASAATSATAPKVLRPVGP